MEDPLIRQRVYEIRQAGLFFLLQTAPLFRSNLVLQLSFIHVNGVDLPNQTQSTDKNGVV